MSGTAGGFPLRHTHVIDVSGAVVGQPVFPLVEISRVLREEIPQLRAASRDPNSSLARCAECLREQTSDIHPPNALISFLRQERDIWVLSVRPEHVNPADESAFGAHLTVLEPLALGRSKRIVVTATVTCRRDGLGGGAAYTASVPVYSEDAEVMHASYDGLLLIDKVLSRLAVSPVTHSDLSL